MKSRVNSLFSPGGAAVTHSASTLDILRYYRPNIGQLPVRCKKYCIAFRQLF